MGGPDIDWVVKPDTGTGARNWRARYRPGGQAGHWNSRTLEQVLEMGGPDIDWVVKPDTGTGARNGRARYRPGGQAGHWNRCLKA
eukprot:scaffold8793_cov119-Isochrysis_galbana.AAC.2